MINYIFLITKFFVNIRKIIFFINKKNEKKSFF